MAHSAMHVRPGLLHFIGHTLPVVFVDIVEDLSIQDGAESLSGRGIGEGDCAIAGDVQDGALSTKLR